MSGRVSADGALVGARIRTLDPDRPWAEAVAWRDGTIVAVGDEAEVREACDARTHVDDLGGAAVVPGLVDAHIHALWATELSEWVVNGTDLRGVRDVAALRAALAAERARVGPGGWVRGWGLVYEAFDGAEIAAREIEDAVGGQPALVRLFDAHTALASRRALQLAGIDGPRAFADGAEVVCDAAGVPTGALLEHGAIALVAAIAPPMGDAERHARSAALQRELAATGLTGAHVMDGAPRSFALLEALEAAGDQLLRMVAPLWLQPSTTDEEIDALLALRDVSGRRWRGGVAKLLIDGVVEGGTAWLEEPDRLGTCTEPFWPDVDRYAAVVARFAGGGFQCVTHTIGDRAVRAALDAYKSAGAAPGVRHRVEHLELVEDAALARLAPEGVVASMQPIHLSGRDPAGQDPWSRRLSQRQRSRAWRMGDVLDAGAVLALGSDWPVAPYDPRLGMAWARLRRPPGAPDVPTPDPDQRLSGLQALHGYTTGAALAVGEEALNGRIRVGMRADLTAFADDPAATGADDLPALPIVVTVVDGAVVHRGSDPITSTTRPSPIPEGHPSR